MPCNHVVGGWCLLADARDPQWFNLIANSTDVVVSGLNLSAVWSTGGETPNTDGWDIYRSDSVVLQDSIVNNGDDCVSFKPNSTNVVVQVSSFISTYHPPTYLMESPLSFFPPSSQAQISYICTVANQPPSFTRSPRTSPATARTASRWARWASTPKSSTSPRT